MNKDFEDHRKVIKNLLELLKNKRVVNERSRFDDLLEQVVNRKSVNNFELFVFAFDKVLEIEDKQINSEKLFEIIRDEKKRDFNLDQSAYATLDLVVETYRQLNTLRQRFQLDYQYQIEKFEMHQGKILFDIFLSHRYINKFYNLIVYYILVNIYKLRVYVDWIEDASKNRKVLVPETVQFLMKRMNMSKNLLFFNIERTNTTNWMAWEVGYFCSFKERNIGILDLNNYCTGNKNVENLSSNARIIQKSSELIVEGANILIDQWATS